MVGVATAIGTKQHKGGPIPKAPSTGSVEVTGVYALTDFLARTRWSKHALATARRNGLRVIVTGGVSFVRGKDFHSYLGKLVGDDE